MFKKISFREIIAKNIYLLLAAAWLFTIAIIIDSYWSASSSIKSAQREFTNYIQDAEKDFRSLVSDEKLLGSIRTGTYDEQDLKKLTGKKYFLYFYKTDSTDDNKLIFWNTQQVLPSAGLFYLAGNSGLVQLQNGYYIWNRISSNQLKAIALIPVKWNYIITNDYLHNDFIPENISQEYSLSLKKTMHP